MSTINKWWHGFLSVTFLRASCATADCHVPVKCNSRDWTSRKLFQFETRITQSEPIKRERIYSLVTQFYHFRIPVLLVLPARLLARLLAPHCDGPLKHQAVKCWWPGVSSLDRWMLRGRTGPARSRPTCVCWGRGSGSGRRPCRGKAAPSSVWLTTLLFITLCYCEPDRTVHRCVLLWAWPHCSSLCVTVSLTALFIAVCYCEPDHTVHRCVLLWAWPHCSSLCVTVSLTTLFIAVCYCEPDRTVHRCVLLWAWPHCSSLCYCEPDHTVHRCVLLWAWPHCSSLCYCEPVRA